MRIVRLAAVALVALSLFMVACDDDGGDDNASTAAGSTAIAGSPTASSRDVTPGSPTPVTPPPVDTPSTDEQEVTGIVGAVISSTSRIEINQLSGADVREVEVTPQTQIRRAVGGTLTLAEIHPSDRILARGTVDGETLIASRITLQEAVPGAQPGG